MPTLMFLFFLQGNMLVEGVMSVGTNFTNTNIHIAPLVAVHAFPFPIKNIGIFNTIGWDNYHFELDPFKVNVKNKTFVVGITYRIIKPRIQPSFRAGIMHYRENIEVTLLDNIFVNGKTKKNALFLGSGAFVKIWKNIYVDPEISLAVSGRPPWRAAVGVGWMF